MNQNLMRHRFPVPAAVVLATLAAGCGDDLLNPGGETAILGNVHVNRAVDPQEPPVFGLGLGVEYVSLSAAPRPGVLAAAQTDGITLALPYPNPLTAPEQTQLTVVVTSDAAREARVEIWAETRGLSTAVAILEDESLTPGENRFRWNATELGSGLRVANGLYSVRVTVPGSGGSSETLSQPLIVNRSMTDVIVLDAFNTFSEGDGDFAIYDLAVGVAFTRTGNDGRVLGPGRLADRVTLFIDDVDYEPRQTVVNVGPGDIATVNLGVTPRSAASPEPLLTAEAATGPARPEP